MEKRTSLGRIGTKHCFGLLGDFLFFLVIKGGEGKLKKKVIYV